jgi:hypothetical protein
MINVVCLRTGTRFHREYVVRLASMFRRQFHLPHAFHCFTDRPDDLSQQVRETYGIIVRPPPCEFRGWWGKVGFFRPDIGESLVFPDAPMLYIDLDMILCGDVAGMLPPFWIPGNHGYLIKRENAFITIRQWKTLKKITKYGRTSQGYNSSLMYWGRAGNRAKVWNQLDEKAMRVWRGDQDWLHVVCPDETVWPDRWFEVPEHFGASGEPDPEVRVVLCNRLDNHKIRHWPWVKENWR